MLWSCLHSTGFKLTPTSRNRFLMSTLIQWSRLINVSVTSPSQVYQALLSPADLFYALTSARLPGYSRLPNNSSLPIIFYSIMAAEVVCFCILLNILFTNSLRISNMNPVYVDHTHLWLFPLIPPRFIHLPQPHILLFFFCNPSSSNYAFHTNHTCGDTH